MATNLLHWGLLALCAGRPICSALAHTDGCSLTLGPDAMASAHKNNVMLVSCRPGWLAGCLQTGTIRRWYPASLFSAHVSTLYTDHTAACAFVNDMKNVICGDVEQNERQNLHFFTHLLTTVLLFYQWKLLCRVSFLPYVTRSSSAVCLVFIAQIFVWLIHLQCSSHCLLSGRPLHHFALKTQATRVLMSRHLLQGDTFSFSASLPFGLCNSVIWSNLLR